jgi:UDP-glucose 4-epimerase
MGTHLVDWLLEGGHHVRVYDRSPSRFRDLPPEAEYMEGELGNHGLIREAVEGMEVVYHLVSTTLPKTSNDDPIYDVLSNLVDTIQLLEACVAAKVRKIVFTSSGGTVYGIPETAPIDEDHPTNPTSSYGIVKLAIEKYLGLFHHLYGLDYVALRISYLYGPYQDPKGQQGAISVFLHRVYAGRTINIWGDGGVVRDYLYVSDLMEALERTADIESRERARDFAKRAGEAHGRGGRRATRGRVLSRPSPGRAGKRAGYRPGTSRTGMESKDGARRGHSPDVGLDPHALRKQGGALTMRVLVTGAGGQLGLELQELLPQRGHEIVALARKELDIIDAWVVREAFDQHSPDLVINAAAY